MKQLSRKLEITYRWWRDDGKAIKPAHVEALNERAMEQFQEQMSDGVVSGQLLDNIRLTNRDPAAGIDYTGWWDVKEVPVEK